MKRYQKFSALFGLSTFEKEKLEFFQRTEGFWKIFMRLFALKLENQEAKKNKKQHINRIIELENKIDFAFLFR